MDNLPKAGQSPATEETKSVVQECAQLLGVAQNNMTACYLVATKKNPMAADVEAFKKLKALSQQLSELMREVSKLRGL